jgi:hypothetical protein
MAAEPLQLPQTIDLEWVATLRLKLDEASRSGPTSLREALPKPVAVAILERTERLLQEEPTLLEVRALAMLYVWLNISVAGKRCCLMPQVLGSTILFVDCTRQ